MAKWLVRKGHQVFLITAPGQLSTLWKQAGLDALVCVEERRDLLRDATRRALVERAVDILHANMMTVQDCSLVASAVSEINSIGKAPPIGFIFKTGRADIYSWDGLAWVEDPNCLGMTAVCESDKTDFISRFPGLPPERIKVFYEGISCQDFEPASVRRGRLRSELGISDGELLVVSVGRFHQEKGYGLVQRAAVSLAEKFPNLRFLFVGPGYGRGRWFRRNMEGWVLADRVIFSGYRTDIPNVLRDADVFVLPSAAEGLPRALLEAMAMATPVIASPVNGVPEAMKGSLTDFQVSPYDHTALAERLRLLCSDADLRSRLGEEARQHVLANFDMERCNARLLEFMEQAVRDFRQRGSGSTQVTCPACVMFVVSTLSTILCEEIAAIAEQVCRGARYQMHVLVVNGGVTPLRQRRLERAGVKTILNVSRSFPLGKSLVRAKQLLAGAKQRMLVVHNHFDGEDVVLDYLGQEGAFVVAYAKHICEYSRTVAARAAMFVVESHRLSLVAQSGLRPEAKLAIIRGLAGSRKYEQSLRKDFRSSVGSGRSGSIVAFSLLASSRDDQHVAVLIAASLLEEHPATVLFVVQAPTRRVFQRIVRRIARWAASAGVDSKIRFFWAGDSQSAAALAFSDLVIVLTPQELRYLRALSVGRQARIVQVPQAALLAAKTVKPTGYPRQEPGISRFVDTLCRLLVTPNDGQTRGELVPETMRGPRRRRRFCRQWKEVLGSPHRTPCSEPLFFPVMPEAVSMELSTRQVRGAGLGSEKAEFDPWMRSQVLESILEEVSLSPQVQNMHVAFRHRGDDCEQIKSVLELIRGAVPWARINATFSDHVLALNPGKLSLQCAGLVNSLTVVIEQPRRNATRVCATVNRFTANAPCPVQILIPRGNLAPGLRYHAEMWREFGYNVTVAGQRGATALPKDSGSTQAFVCHEIFESTTILRDGTVVLCSMVPIRFVRAGQLGHSSIKAIWHGEVYSRFRRSHLAGKREELRPCRRCPSGHAAAWYRR